jgi:hypothetical protein
VQRDGCERSAAKETKHSGDLRNDIGWFNVSAYNMGMMGHRTPNIDGIAHEGMLLTNYYARAVSRDAPRSLLARARYEPDC